MPAVGTMQGIGFTWLDAVALTIFLFAWCLHYWIVNFSPWHKKTISAQMGLVRQRWMYNMALRSVKMPDTLIQNTLQYGVLFFASTSILLIGALIAGLRASDHAVQLLSDLPFTVGTTKSVWELKVLVVMFIFTFAFFKFAWSHRLFNYVLILIGAAPDPSVAAKEGYTDSINAENYAITVGKLHALGARHFTTGLNAYFFAMAASAWFVSPKLFIVATIWVSFVLYRRAFWSVFGKTLRGIEGIDREI